MSSPIKNWRERIGRSADFPLHNPNDVERAMVAQIADLEAALQAATFATTAQHIVLAGQRLGKQALLDLQRDAARYRWLRDKADGMAGTAAPMVASLDEAGRAIDFLDGEDLDAAVDRAKLLKPVPRAPKRRTA